MQIESSPRTEPEQTYRTLVRFLTGVYPLVYSEWSTLTKTFSAILARVRLFATVHSFVHYQVILFGEAFVAILTGIRFVSGVDAFVHRQFAVLRKTFTARVAKVFFRMGPHLSVHLVDVFFQRFRFAVLPVTVQTLIGQHLTLDCYSVCSDLMSVQIPIKCQTDL